MLKNVQDVTNDGKQTGLNTQDNILGIDKSQSPDMMDVRVHFDGSLEKRLGSNTQNAVIIAAEASNFNPNASALTNNLQAFWRLDEANGNRLSAFGGYTLTDRNSVKSAVGIKSQAALFKSTTNQYLIIPNTAGLTTATTSFGISTWFYMNATSTTVEKTIVSKRDVGTHDIVLLLHCDGADGSTSFPDSSDSGKTVTSNGNAQVDTAQVKYGTGSCLFDGAGDFLSVPDSTDWYFAAGDFTISAWVRFADVSAARTICSQFQDANNYWSFVYSPGNGGITFEFVNAGNLIYWFASWAPSVDTWYHVEMSRSNGIFRFFIDGAIYFISDDSTATNEVPNCAAALQVGIFNSVSAPMNGWIDDLRIVKGRAEHTNSFTPPVAAYPAPADPTNYEYWLFVNTDNVLTFRVSSSGTTHNGQVRATSFGALTTSTWYHAIAYHDSANGLLAVGVNLSMTSGAYTAGVRSGSAPFVLGSVSDGSMASFDGRIDETGFWKSILTTSQRSDLYNSGNGNTYQVTNNAYPWASFDFGAGSTGTRWLMCAAGTGIYASSNLGVTWVNVATDRTANYQYFDRSKNVLVATSDSYDNPLYWPGSAGTFMAVLNPSAPLCKYSINFQGFLILLNSNTRKRGFFYQDENTQLTGAFSSSFDIPSSADDEITAAFVFRKNLYVSTRYYLYRVSYVGGNPDFSYEKVKDWGYVPRTAKQIYVDGVGQVVEGLCWDGKLRLFDGSDDQINSNSVEQDNQICEFALDKLSFAGSGPVISFAETDYNENVYKLVIAIGEQSSQTTHMLNYDGRAKAFYPYSRQNFNTMTMAESANKRFLMAFDRSGFCHMMDSGNLDGNTSPINEKYTSNFIFEKSPAQSQKGHETHMFFTNTTAGRLQYFDQTDFSDEFKFKESFVLNGSDRRCMTHKVIDVPESYNVYRWMITSSGSTADPWKLQRYDHMMRGLGIGKNED